MSFDIFLQGFSGSCLDPAQERTVRDLIEPHIESNGDRWVRVVSSDGGADIYGYGEGPIDGFVVTQAQGREVWNLLHRVATAAAFAVMPVGCGTLLPPGFDRQSLPDGVPEPILDVGSGAEIIAAIERA